MALVFKFDLYHLFESLEWATTYYWPNPTPPTPTQMAAVADAEATLFSENIVINRWELFGAAGTKLDEGAFTPIPGYVLSSMVHVHYCLLLRENAPADKRPSVKYIHGYGVSAFSGLGELASAYTTLIAGYGSSLNSIGVVDSDGGAVSGVSFRGFSRRTKMRQISQ